MDLEVRIVPGVWGYRLDLYHAGDHIDEYERSMVKGEHAEAEAKRREAEGAAGLLLETYRRRGTKIAVRWNSSEKRKEIRACQEGQKNPESGGTVLDLIPRSFWRKG